MVRIREANASDLPFLIDLRLKMISACPDSFLDDYGELTEWTAEDWKKWLFRLTETENSNLVVAEEDGQLIGVVGCKGVKHKRARHVATLVGVGVLPSYRGKGIGRRMLDYVISWVKKQTKIERLQLTVYADNETAVKFYEKLGFKKEGLFEHYARGKNGEFQAGIPMALFIPPRD